MDRAQVRGLRFTLSVLPKCPFEFLSVGNPSCAPNWVVTLQKATGNILDSLSASITFAIRIRRVRKGPASLDKNNQTPFKFMESLLALSAGIGLSAACGFRVFVPLLVMSLAERSGHLSLLPSFQWMGSDAALIAFSAATVFEIAGYYIPWVDNFLDTIATPAALVAGTIVTASMATDVSPFLRWTLAVVAGGGAAGAVQASTVLVRGLSTASTGGLANPMFATVELGASLMASVMSLFVPFLAIALVLVALIVAAKYTRKRQKAATAVTPTTPAIS